MEPARIALDSSFLLSIAELKVDVFREIRETLGKAEFFVPGAVKREMEKLEKEGKKKWIAVRIAKNLAEKNQAKEVEVEAESPDKALERLAEQGYYVATNDSELRKRIKEKRGKVVLIKQKKKIEIE